MAVAAAGVVLAARRGSPEHVTLRLVVSASADVTVEPGQRHCRARCRFDFERGTRIRLHARSRGAVRFLGWYGACSGPDCAFSLRRSRTVIARFRTTRSAGLQSWSASTGCRPMKTTIAKLVGSTTGPGGVPLEAGGRFQPHLRGPRQQHLLRPPCLIGGTPTFVEIDDVAISGAVLRAADGDVVTHALDTGSRERNPYLRTLRVEIDATWLRAGAAIRDFPSQPARIDLQGFVYWNTGHSLSEPPEPSGWELHPVSAWLPAAG